MSDAAWITVGSILSIMTISFVIWLMWAIKGVECRHGHNCLCAGDAIGSALILISICTFVILPVIVIITVANVLY